MKVWFRKLALRYLLWAEHFMFERKYPVESTRGDIWLMNFNIYLSKSKQYREELKKLKS